MIDKLTYLETKNEKYPMIFTLNVMESIQDKYGSLNKWSDLMKNTEEPNIKALKFFLSEVIKEGIEIENKGRKPPTLKQIGRLISEIGISKASQKIKDLVTKSIKISDFEEENEENSEVEDVKNMKTMQNQTV